MSSMLNDYSVAAADWRGLIRKNSRRSFMVILTFILIYVALGLLIDTFIYSGHYPQAPLSLIFKALITLQLFPMATCITVGIAVISLLVTFKFYDRLMLLGTEYREITPDTAQNIEETQLYNVVDEMRIAAGLRFMPKVYLIEADYMNAFASGYSEKSAMVAITRGLMQKLDRSELQAVMAHEISHIRHLDIKLTLVAAILSNLLLMVIDFLFYSSMFGSRSSDNRSRNQLAFVILILRFLLPLITILLTLYLSRTREYMADAGCVELTRDNQPLARALLKIQQDHVQNQEAYQYAYHETPNESVRRQAYIFDPVDVGIEPVKSFADAFSTHPDIEKRLEAIGIKRKT